MRSLLFAAAIAALPGHELLADVPNEVLKSALRSGNMEQITTWDELGLLVPGRVGEGNPKVRLGLILQPTLGICRKEAFDAGIRQTKAAMASKRDMDSFRLSPAPASPRTLKLLELLSRNGFSVPRNAALVAAYYGCARDVIEWYAARSPTSPSGRLENSEEYDGADLLPYGGVSEFKQVPVLVRMLTFSGEFGGLDSRDYATAQGSWLALLDAIDTLYGLGVRADEPVALEGEKLFVVGLERGTTALHQAARIAMKVQERGLAQHVFDRALKAHGGVSARTASGRTPLWYLAPDAGDRNVGSCCNDEREFMRRIKSFTAALGTAGADLGSMDRGGRTLVEALATEGFTGYARAMKEAGAR